MCVEYSYKNAEIIKSGQKARWRRRAAENETTKMNSMREKKDLERMMSEKKSHRRADDICKLNYISEIYNMKLSHKYSTWCEKKHK